MSSIYSVTKSLKFYVYAYLRTDGTPYYIGKGKDNRVYKKHTTISVPKDKSRIVFLENNLTEIGALALERFYIRWYGRKDLGTGILRNLTDGGEGVSGLIFSPKHRAKLSEANKGKISWFKDKKLSPEHIAKISAANKGKKHSPESRAKMSAAKKGKISWFKGKKLSPETLAKMSIAKKGKKLSPEHIAKISAAQVNRFINR
jgi:hypothetical protein